MTTFRKSYPINYKRNFKNFMFNRNTIYIFLRFAKWFIGLEQDTKILHFKKSIVPKEPGYNQQANIWLVHETQIKGLETFLEIDQHFENGCFWDVRWLTVCKCHLLNAFQSFKSRLGTKWTCHIHKSLMMSRNRLNILATFYLVGSAQGIKY